MSKHDDYKPGNPEYDFWNDKNLYPSLCHKEDSRPHPTNNNEDSTVSAGSIFLVTFVWIFILAPLTIFFTWEDWIIQVIFWGGIIVIILVFAAWIHDAIEKEKHK